MELLVFGHAGARVFVFPTSMGRFFDWENRHMMELLGHHIENGWLQVYCVDSVDSESWYNDHADPCQKAARHMQFHDYMINEVLPFSRSKNDNPFSIAVGASFGAYHAVNIGLRFPWHFNRILAMSGLYDLNGWTHGYQSEAIYLSNPLEYMKWLNDPAKLEQIKKMDIILPIGRDDQSFERSHGFSNVLWERGVWHAFRVWDGMAHDWQYWEKMLLLYIAGQNTSNSSAA